MECVINIPLNFTEFVCRLWLRQQTHKGSEEQNQDPLFALTRLLFRTDQGLMFYMVLPCETDGFHCPKRLLAHRNCQWSSTNDARG